MTVLPNTIPASEVRRYFDYDAAIGDLRWKLRSDRGARARIGSVVGWSDRKGYRRVDVAGTRVTLHRLIWAWHHGVFPAGDIDHINCDARDNRIENLREASRGENRINARRLKRCDSPYKGIYRSHHIPPRWAAQIGCRGKRFHLGCFPSPEEARDAYLAKARDLFGEFARVA